MGVYLRLRAYMRTIHVYYACALYCTHSLYRTLPAHPGPLSHHQPNTLYSHLSPWGIRQHLSLSYLTPYQHFRPIVAFTHDFWASNGPILGYSKAPRYRRFHHRNAKTSTTTQAHIPIAATKGKHLSLNLLNAALHLGRRILYGACGHMVNG